MLFNSFEFLAFLTGVYGLYLLLRHRGQNWLLLFASYLFYGRWDWRFLSLILVSTFVDYACGLWIHSASTRTKRRVFLTLSMVTNLGILFSLKYFDFFRASFAALLQSFGYEADWRLFNFILPVGISFYTFQTMSYTIDIYRGQLAPTRNLRDFALFVAFFPQLVAGPIERASHLLPQVTQPRRVTYWMVRQACWLILLGYFKKVVLADNMAAFTKPVFDDPGAADGLSSAIAVYAFAFQIYGDFSGYTDIARGVAMLMGFDLMLNFRMPYFATNPSDFWRRWHISLSTWLRDYLYIPLGGSRGGPIATYRNLIITMLLGGLWHGAAWHFVAWGAFHGAILAIHRMISPALRAITPQTGRTGAWWRLACIVFFFHVTCFGWLLFAVRNLSDVPILLGRMLEPWRTNDWLAIATIVMLAGPVMVLQVFKERSDNMMVVKTWPRVVRLAVYAFVFWMIVVCGVADQHEFIYFQF